jgi:hypothetical protein
VAPLGGVSSCFRSFFDAPQAQGAHRRRITAVSSQEIARYITDETMASIVIPVITMFILKICAPYWMR